MRVEDKIYLIEAKRQSKSILWIFVVVVALSLIIILVSKKNKLRNYVVDILQMVKKIIAYQL